MRVDFPDKESMDQTLRILMRSRHIYILFSSLIHLSLGAYLQIRPRTWQKALQITGSAILIASSLLLIWAFYTETYQIHSFSSVSSYGIYTSLAGIGLHVIGGISGRRAE
jgi:TRAP-type C4-dicarboxylate transport system permease small subunit